MTYIQINDARCAKGDTDEFVIKKRKRTSGNRDEDDAEEEGREGMKGEEREKHEH